MHHLFEDRVSISQGSGCWEWLKYRDRQGYGRITYQNRRVFAHRLSYELHVGPIEGELTVDHICYTPACVNPRHLRLLTHAENARRQRSSFATHCASGHVFDDANTYIKPGFRNGNRTCRQCNAAAARRYKQRRLNKGAAA